MSINKIYKLNFLSKYPIILYLLISFIVLTIYSEVLKADFVMWDDDITIYANPNMGRLSFDRICWAFSDVNSTMRYIPLTLMSWITTYHLWGLNPLGYHLLNWLLHGLSSGLLFLIIKNILLLSQQIKIDNNDVKRTVNISALLATLCWALHPLRVEPVAWVTDLSYCLAVFFLLLSTLCYIEAVTSQSDIKRYFYMIISAFVFYTFSLLSHPMGITYFIIFIILDIFLFKRIGGDIGCLKSPTAKKVLLEKLIFATSAVSIGAIAIVVYFNYAGSFWKPPVSLSDFGLFERIMQAMYILAYYIWRPLYPVNLSPVYTTLNSFNPLSMPFILSAFFILTISMMLYIFRKRWSMIFALWLAYIILLIPVMGFFEHPHSPCDRYALVPSICLSVLIAFGLIRLMKNGYYSRLSFSVLLIIIITFGWLSVKQIKIWNNSEYLFSYIIKTLGNDPYRQDIYWRLGKYLLQKGKTEHAIINFDKTLTINPYHPIANAYLAKIEYKNNDFAKSLYHLQNILISEPNNFIVHYQLSKLFDILNNKKESAYHLKRADQLKRLNDSKLK